MGQWFKSLVCDDQDVGVKVESTFGCLAGKVAVCEMFGASRWRVGRVA